RGEPGTPVVRREPAPGHRPDRPASAALYKWRSVPAGAGPAAAAPRAPGPRAPGPGTGGPGTALPDRAAPRVPRPGSAAPVVAGPRPGTPGAGVPVGAGGAGGGPLLRRPRLSRDVDLTGQLDSGHRIGDV